MHLRTAFVAALLAVLAGCASTGDRPHRWLTGAQPDYPPAARSAGVEGWVSVRYRITAAGAVEDAVVLEADPPGVFEQTALAAVRTWHYAAARRDGRPVAIDNVVSTLRFSLDDSAYADY